MSRRLSVHQAVRIDVDTATGAPSWVTVDVRVFFPADTSPGLIAEHLRDVVRRVISQLDGARPRVTVELPETDERVMDLSALEEGS